MADANLFGEQFGGDSWAAWRALLAGFYGLPLDKTEADTFKTLTGRQSAPQSAHDELWLAVGRRGGKSQCAALLAVYEAAFRDYRAQLAPGEVATVMVLAADRKQARSVMRYISGLVESNPMLRQMVAREDRESIELTNRTAIEVHTASFRTVRGYTLACCIADEVAFWRSEDSANPDYEIINALRPAMATLGGKLVALSSPYAKRGELWENHRRYFGKPDSILVARAASRTMNPTLPEHIVNRALERDEAAARAEYMAEFRSDIASFVDRETVEELARDKPATLPFDRANAYFAFADPNGGGKDEFTLAIGHDDGGKTVTDLLLARTGKPQDIVADYADVLKQYRVYDVTADRYAGSWPADEFKRHGIHLEHSTKVRSDLYRDALAVINSGRCELPPDTRMVAQFTSLERRTSRSGKDTIDHPSGGHDDRANVVAGLLANARQTRGTSPETWAKLAGY
ncbi:hypothetical protein [Salinisphaera orenii]|uniref:hypothetical protein n=1 Tax=Salinisphaera orenii TaxID=856731 RepID=UPI00195513E9